MKNWSLAIVSLSFVLISAHANGSDLSPCAAPEFEYMQDQEYLEAAELFEEALAVHLFETPNFELLPRLAWAYFQAGNRQEAENALLEAELSLLVLTGIAKCVETTLEDGMFYLRGTDGSRLSGIVSNNVMDRMCGGFYDGYYEPRSLDQVLQDAKLVQNYFDIKQRIQGGKTK